MTKAYFKKRTKISQCILAMFSKVWTILKVDILSIYFGNQVVDSSQAPFSLFLCK